jgi:tRNA-Thr(GGU) m(6)t(6)A37 methyltransferase TsaA
MKIEYEPIGIVRSPHQVATGTPIQPSRAKGVFGTIELQPKYAPGLADLDGFSHIVVVCHFDRVREFKLSVIPYLDTVPRGLFSTRAPSRPNPIGLSVVRLVGIEGNVLTVEGVDILDGTPVLDIKPWLGEFEQPLDVRCGWFAAARERQVKADDRFEGPSTTH